MRTLVVAVALGFGAGAAQAEPINAGFETGDLSGWSTSLDLSISEGGHAWVVTSFETFDPPVTYLPVVGSYFLAIESGATDFWQTVYQTVSLAAGETLSGFAAFDWGDYDDTEGETGLLYADGAKVEILDSWGGSVLATPFYMDGTGHPDGYNGPWTPWSWTATSAGTYTLAYAARNTLDDGGWAETFGYFDATVIAVPEPGSLALLGLGLGGLGFLRRRKA